MTTKLFRARPGYLNNNIMETRSLTKAGRAKASMPLESYWRPGVVAKPTDSKEASCVLKRTKIFAMCKYLNFLQSTLSS